MKSIPGRNHQLTLLLLAWVVLLTCMALASAAAAIRYTMPAGVQLHSPTIQRVRGVDATKLLAQTVTVEGYYYDGSIPMVIDDINRVALDLPLPDESFVPVVGAVPATLKSGDRVSLSGTLFRPTNNDQVGVRGETTAIRIQNAGQIKVLQASALPRLAITTIKIPVGGIKPIKNRYAVLIAGCINPSNNHIRYWNDLVTMYNILIGRGFQPGNITVLYADGVARPGVAASIPVNYAATPDNITTVFNQLATKVTVNDDVYIMLNDHGGGLMTVPSGGYAAGMYGGIVDPAGGDAFDEKYNEAALHMDINGDGHENSTVAVHQVLCLWNWADMTDRQFAAEVNKVSRAKNIIIQMKQCFNGGFINNLRAANRIIMSSSSSDQPSWGHGPDYNFGEFTFWYFAALTGHKPDGSGAVDADANHDGKISILEAYNFARTHDTQPEILSYEGDGIAPAHTDPSGTEAVSGAAYIL